MSGVVGVGDLRSGLIEDSLEQLDRLDYTMERDVEELDELLSELSDMDLTFRAGLSNGDADTEKVMKVYEETFHDIDGREDIQELNSSLDLSAPAAEFFGELTNLASIGKEQAYQKASFLDGKNNLTATHYKELVTYLKSFKSVRDQLSDDVAGERESLSYYDSEIDRIADKVVETVEENPLTDLEVADAGQVLEDLEEYQERIQQLRKRRVHEVKRRKEIYDTLAEKNFVKTYSAAGSKTPVVDELDHLDEMVETAYRNVVSTF
jgi:DNA repair exonuclease SbcCD ATPase subunit